MDNGNRLHASNQMHNLQGNSSSSTLQQLSNTDADTSMTSALQQYLREISGTEPKYVAGIPMEEKDTLPSGTGCLPKKLQTEIPQLSSNPTGQELTTPCNTRKQSSPGN